MQSVHLLRSSRPGDQYAGSTLQPNVTADDSLDYDFTGQSAGTDVTIAANVGDNLVFNVNASYTTGAGGGSTPEYLQLSCYCI